MPIERPKNGALSEAQADRSLFRHIPLNSRLLENMNMCEFFARSFLELRTPVFYHHNYWFFFFSALPRNQKSARGFYGKLN